MLTMLPAAFLLAALAALQPTPFPADPPITCSNCPGWNGSHEPVRLFGNTYFVGTAGLGSVLVTSPGGHILLDGGLPQSAPVIAANIRALGFRLEDIRLIVNSHAHYDHAGGIHALQRATGAEVAASASGAQALRAGKPTADDPQLRSALAFPAVDRVRVVADGETLRVGDLAVTAHATPGHTPGATTWTWRSCESSRCLDIVYADSLNAISDDGFRFTGDATHPSLVASFRKSIDTVAALPCDIVVAVHPGLADLEARLARRAKGETPDPIVDAQGCRAYAAAARATLERRISDER